MDDLLRYRLRNDDLHPLEEFALLARHGLVSVEPYREVKPGKIRATIRKLPRIGEVDPPGLSWGCEGDLRSPIWLHAIGLGLSYRWGNAGLWQDSRCCWRSVNNTRWSDSTEWHTLPSGETHGLRRVMGTFVHDGNYDPAVVDHIRMGLMRQLARTPNTVTRTPLS